MANIFVVLTLVSLLGLIIGIISPDKALFWKAENKTRKNSLLIYGLGTIIFFIAFGVLSDSSQSNSSDNDNTQTVKIADKETEPEGTDAIVEQKNFGKMLATLDDKETDDFTVNEINSLLVNLSSQYKEPVDTIAEYTSRVQGVLNNNGIKKSNLEILKELKESNTSNLEGVKFKEISTLYLMSKTK